MIIKEVTEEVLREFGKRIQATIPNVTPVKIELPNELVIRHKKNGFIQLYTVPLYEGDNLDFRVTMLKNDLGE